LDIKRKAMRKITSCFLEERNNKKTLSQTSKTVPGYMTLNLFKMLVAYSTVQE
jgi:hypothetical protein